MHRRARSEVNRDPASAVRAEEINAPQATRAHAEARAPSPPTRSFISGSLERTPVTAVVLGHKQARCTFGPCRAAHSLFRFCFSVELKSGEVIWCLCLPVK